MTPDQAQALIKKVRKAAKECNAWFQVTVNEKPDLDNVKIEINGKVKNASKFESVTDKDFDKMVFDALK